MLNRLTRSRTLTVSASCVLHVALIVALLLAERFIMSAHASKPPVLPIEIVTLADSPPPEPLPEKAPPPKPVPKKIIKPPRPIEPAVRPQVTEAVTEPRPTPPPPAPEPAPAPATAMPAPPSPAPANPAPANPAPVVQARTSGPAGMSVAASTDGPPSALAGSPTAPTTGPPGPGSQSAVASIPSKGTASTGGITRTARPQGGYQVRPSYPASARRLGIQGITMLRVHVLVDGRVGDVLVETSAGHPDLDQAAMEAVGKWRFEPARRGKEAVVVWVTLPVRFELKTP
jgi:protein TonB